MFTILERMRVVPITAVSPRIGGWDGVKPASVHVFAPERAEIGRVRSVDVRVYDVRVQRYRI